MLGALIEWGGVRSHVSWDRPMPGSCSSSASSASMRAGKGITGRAVLKLASLYRSVSLRRRGR